MDVLVARAIFKNVNKNKDAKENYYDGVPFKRDRDGYRYIETYDTSSDHRHEEKINGVSWLLITLWTLLWGLPAAYLSWTSNTLVEWHIIFKVLFSIGAFFWGIAYLLGYLIFRLDLVLYCQNRSGFPFFSWSTTQNPTPSTAAT